MLAYYEGYSYCKNGGKLEECPFPKKSSKRKLWIQGFEDCKENVQLPTLSEVGIMENDIKENP